MKPRLRWFVPLAVLAVFVSPVADSASFSEPFSIEPLDDPESVSEGVEILGVLRLSVATPDGTAIRELSALAWDEDEQLLYAISDEGWLFHLKPWFQDCHLVAADYVAGYRLRGASGRHLRGRWRDSEGLVIRNGSNGRHGDTELVVSFETVPRIRRFSIDGRDLGGVELPPSLRDVEAYQDPNRALEALAEHPDLGLLTLPEHGLLEDAAGTISLFDMSGRRWSYTPAPVFGSSVVSLDALPDGRLLVLERAYVSFFTPLVVTLRLAELGEAPAMKVHTLATLDAAKGWSIDNFEGLARHRDDRFFMVSDDNGNGFQNTLLVYLRLTGLGKGGD